MNETRLGIAVKVYINEQSVISHHAGCTVFLLDESQEAIALTLAMRGQKGPVHAKFRLLGLVRVLKGI